MRFPLLPATVAPLLLDLLICGQPKPCEMPFPQGRECPRSACTSHPHPQHQGTPKLEVKGDLGLCIASTCHRASLPGLSGPAAASVPAFPWGLDHQEMGLLGKQITRDPN